MRRSIARPPGPVGDEPLAATVAARRARFVALLERLVGMEPGQAHRLFRPLGDSQPSDHRRRHRRKGFWRVVR